MASMKRWMTLAAYDVIVVGGGAAGMFSAAAAAFTGASVLLLEKTERLGWKLSITGKGRCNITNDCSGDDVLKNVPRNARFLYSSMAAFPPERTKAFFEGLGLPLKTERGARVFPVSDRAGDVVSCLKENLRRTGVRTEHACVRKLLATEGCISGVSTDRGDYYAPKVILATGGRSYPQTGSTGDGYEMAAAFGHTVTQCSGSLVPLELEGEELPALAGLHLRNIGLKLWNGRKKPIYQDFGEALFMSYGISGPTVLSASAHMEEKTGSYALSLDLKPALDDKKLDARLLRDFSLKKNENMYQGIRGLLPAQLVPVILNRAGVSPGLPVHELTKKQRCDILRIIKDLRFSVSGKRPVEEAIVTRGGIRVSEVNPATMESKLVPGLYFAGEILDVDGYTGGFNLQIAWATGYAAGTACGKKTPNVV